MARLTLLILSAAASFFFFCNGQTPGATDCSAKMHDRGVAWDKLNAGLLEQADKMMKEADEIYYSYFKGVSNAYGNEMAACHDEHDFIILNYSKNGIDDVIDKWQHPKLMGLPDFQTFV